MLENLSLTCPVCGEPLPAPKGRGRPREFCGKTCTARARQRRERAAGLLEHALRQDELADEIRRGVRRGMGTPESLTARAGRLREIATSELRGLPLQGRTREP